MLKKSISVGIIIFFVFSSFSTIVIGFDAEGEWATLDVNMPKSNPQALNNITIEILGGFGIRFIIHNNGNETILMNCIVTADAPLLFIGSEISFSSTLLEGSSETVSTSVFGFGKINITVRVNDVVESRSGFIFGPFVFFPKENLKSNNIQYIKGEVI